MIENLPLIATNLQVAIDLLKERYDNKLANIYCHIKGLLEVPSMNKSNSSALREFIVKIKQCLINLNVPVREWNFILVYTLSQKLDSNMRRAYELERGPSQLPSLDGFIEFVEKRCLAAENLSSPEPSHKNIHFAKTEAPSKFPSSCIFCKITNHSLHNWFKFKKLYVNQRKQFVYSNHLCFKCFSPYYVNHCSWKNCPIRGNAHKSLLHKDKVTPDETSNVHVQEKFSKNSKTNFQSVSGETKLSHVNGSYKHNTVSNREQNDKTEQMWVVKMR